jgi:hypothetical protein
MHAYVYNITVQEVDSIVKLKNERKSNIDDIAVYAAS